MGRLEFAVRLLVSRAARWVIRRTDPDAPPPREWPVELLAELLSAQARKIRLERIGAHTGGPVVPFAALADEDRRAWLDCAEAMVELGWGPGPV